MSSACGLRHIHAPNSMAMLAGLFAGNLSTFQQISVSEISQFLRDVASQYFSSVLC